MRIPSREQPASESALTGRLGLARGRRRRYGWIEPTTAAKLLFALRALARIGSALAWLGFAWAPSPAPAQPAPSVFLEDFTWTELRDAIGAGKTTILVPIGGTEQNGPAMALGKHNVRVKFLSEKIALALGNALVAPVIAYVPEGSVSPPTEHMRFPGTITISDKAFEQTLEGAARSFKLHGFKDIVFLGDHGGYQENDRASAQRLNREWAGSGARAYAIDEYYAVTQREYAKVLQDQGVTPAEIGTHAGVSDTSLMLALDPRLVREGKLTMGPKFSAADGVYGDPAKASARLGLLGVDLIVARTVAAIKAAAARR